jgi:hypothetical protein
VRTLVEALHFQEVEDPGFTTLLEANEEPLPMAGSSTVPRPGVGYLPNSEHRAWTLETIRTRQEANPQEYKARGSDVAQRRMAIKSLDDPVETFDPRVDNETFVALEIRIRPNERFRLIVLFGVSKRKEGKRFK